MLYAPALIEQSMSFFGEWLTETRERRGLSQRALAQKVNLSPAAISKMEAGLIGADRKTVVELADAMEVTRADAIRAWLHDDLSPGEQDTITYVRDPDAAYIVESYSGLKPRDKRLARSLIEQLREAEREESIGGGTDREIVTDDDNDDSSDPPIHFKRPDEE